MDYETFTTEFLDYLKKMTKKLSIEQSKKLIQANLEEDSNVITMEKFINDLIDIVFQTSKDKFGVIKKAFKHESMATVYRYFKNSTVMIKAVEADNKYALEWFLSMKVSPYSQDENSMTALMYVVQKTNDLNNAARVITTNTRYPMSYDYTRKFDSFIKILGSDKNILTKKIIMEEQHYFTLLIKKME